MIQIIRVEEARHSPQDKGTLTLLMCELLSASFPTQPSWSEEFWQGVGALNASTAFNVPDQPYLRPPPTSSAHILGRLFNLRPEPSALLQAVFLEAYLSSALPLAAPPDRSCRIDLHSSHHLAFSNLGLLMDLNTNSQVCPPCSDPTGLCPVGEGSLRHPCLSFEAPLGRSQFMLPPQSCRDWMAGVGMCDQQQETGMPKLSVRWSKSGAIQIFLTSPLKLCGCRGSGCPWGPRGSQNKATWNEDLPPCTWLRDHTPEAR